MSIDEKFQDPFNVLAYLKSLFPGIELHAQSVRLVQTGQDWPTIELSLFVDMTAVEPFRVAVSVETETPK